MTRSIRGLFGLVKSGSMPFLLVLVILFSLIGILSQSGLVSAWPMDQSFVTRVDLRLYHLPTGWSFQYPRLSWSGGVSASLLIGLYKLVVSPSAESLNWHAKGIATILFLVSACSLCVVFVHDWISRALSFLVIATSALQFAEPSSDVIAAALFSFFLLSIRLGWPRPASSGLLVLFGLSKIQLLACSLGVGAVWYWWDFRQSRRLSWQIPLSIIFYLFLLLAPGLKLYGADMIRTNKGLRTFASSYMLFFAPHQFLMSSSSTLASSLDWQDVMRSVFPKARTVSDVIRLYPLKYLDYVLVSGIRSIFVVLLTIGPMLIPFVQAFKYRSFPSTTSLSMRLLGAAAVLSLLPPLLLRFISPRYLAVVFIPLVVFSAAAASSPAAPRRLKTTFIICSIASLILNLFLFVDRLVQSPHMPLG